MQHLLNDTLLIAHQDTYLFGNKKETISSVIGKNHLTNTLSPLGKALNTFLNFIDKDHSMNSIIYDVKAYLEQ
jgi:8-oxo-dGTP diphosphatase